VSRGGFDEGEMGSIVRLFDCSCSTSVVAEAVLKVKTHEKIDGAVCLSGNVEVVETERFKSPVDIDEPSCLSAYRYVGVRFGFDGRERLSLSCLVDWHAQYGDCYCLLTLAFL